MKKVLYFTIISLILIINTSCNNTLVVEDMVEFDRAFIPVFYYTSVGDLENAQKAMYPLNAKWGKFHAAYKNKRPESDDWNESMRLVGAWLEETNCALKDGDAERAQFQLDHARYELMDLRWRENMDDYYLDYIWDLEASINVAIQVANDPMIELLEWNELEPYCNEVVVAWKNIVQQPVNQKLFDFSPDEVRHLYYQRDKLDFAIHNLQSAMETAERCEVADAALAIEPAYLNFVAMFGDFDATQTFFALN